jgi:hypothetical protein
LSGRTLHREERVLLGEMQRAEWATASARLTAVIEAKAI